jgi:hypothetical protein
MCSSLGFDYLSKAACRRLVATGTECGDGSHTIISL